MFYASFLIAYTIWFAAGPVTIMISQVFLAKWVREKLMMMVQRGVALSGHSAVLALMKPAAFGQNFPLASCIDTDQSSDDNKEKGDDLTPFLRYKA